MRIEPMSRYTKESLEELKRRVDLVDLISSHIDVQKTGANYKALCPFHEERTPSFTIQPGAGHYHCFGCGAHGDAISFLMEHLGLSFREALEALAERYGVILEQQSGPAYEGPSNTELKSALAKFEEFYHAMLVRTEEGKEARGYLKQRGISEEFIRRFRLGFSPRTPGLFVKAAEKFGIKEPLLRLSGLVSQGSWQRGRDLFSGRILFPVRDAMGRTIAFSARKIRDEDLGGKYINTPKTPLFVKSRVLFGLSESRQRIVKERKAIVVEGQLDALALIDAGLNLAVAALGTAFGEGHVEELKKLGVNEVFLAMDSDKAGVQAALKSGDMLASQGIAVRVIALPQNAPDPDSFIRLEGSHAFEELMASAEPYLDYIVRIQVDQSASSDKRAQGVRAIAEQIGAWQDTIASHTALRALSELTHTPEHLLTESRPRPLLREKISALGQRLPQRIAVEEDVIYWLLFADSSSCARFFELAERNLSPEHFATPVLRSAFIHLLEMYQKGEAIDLLTLLTYTGEESEGELEQIAKKKMHRERADSLFEKALTLLLERAWLEEREAIRQKIQSGACSEDEVLELAKAFDAIKNSPPQLAQ
jgi:DNA primase